MSTSTRIVIAALGGEGGGVLAKWIADMAARQGYLSQSTSVPGVAQRTGATIYYIELFPLDHSQGVGKRPVMSMFPTPGDVDIVICSEIVEAGRMIQRGFVTPDRTTLIASTHRVYGIAEKEAMGTGVIDKDAIVDVARERSKTFIGFDMQQTARQFDSVINTCLFGALAQTGVLPFDRDAFENTIREGGIAIKRNMATFGASFDLSAREQSVDNAAIVETFDPSGSDDKKAFSLPTGQSLEGRALLARVAAFPEAAHEMMYLGITKLVDYQDFAYANDYLDRLQALGLAVPDADADLTTETARYLALWMAFEDLPRVAQIKISEQRFARFREEVKAEQEQPVQMVEFLHPRIEEFCGLMPARLGRHMLNSPGWRRVLGLFAKPRHMHTNSVHGYLMFYLLAKLRRFRRGSLAHQEELEHINAWLEALQQAKTTDLELARELARCGRLIKGYSKTRERGLGHMQRILTALSDGVVVSASALSALREAAFAGEDGKAFIEAETLLRVAQQDAASAAARAELAHVSTPEHSNLDQAEAGRLSASMSISKLKTNSPY
ncbi:MAG: indolepyruvate oxidoreductase subunit beta family protein [Pseudomonadota bacterium]